jgi:mitotic spindle assembly checkpoint protein MAD2B
MIAGVLSEFVETIVHNILKYRKLYPQNIFEQRSKYGISVWQSRHPDVNKYIRKVLDNSKQLLEKGLIDSYIFTTYDNRGNIIDQIVISLKIKKQLTSSSSSTTTNLTTDQLYYLEEEFRSFILQLGLQENILMRLGDDCSWALMIETIEDTTSDMLQSTLTSGDWLVDNNMLPSSRNNTSNNDDNQQFMIRPIKSFQSNHINISLTVILKH